MAPTTGVACLPLLLGLLLAAAPAHVHGQALSANSALDAVQAVPFLSTMGQAITAANLTKLFGPEFNGTLFAPNDQAWLNYAKANNLASPAQLLVAPNNASLLQTLAYHVVPGVVLQQRQFKDRMSLPTLDKGQSLTSSLEAFPLIHIYGSNPLNVATILSSQPVKGNRAVVHVVDTVLVPGVAS